MAGEWKTIDQRELKARGARKKQRRAAQAASTGGALAGTAYFISPQQSKNVGNAVKYAPATRRVMGAKSTAENLARVGRRNPYGAAAVGGAALAAGGASAWGVNRGVEAYHQHKINQRRRSRVGKVQKNMNASAWGIDHGTEVTKAADPAMRWRAADRDRHNKAVDRGAWAGLGTGAVAGVAMTRAPGVRRGAKAGYSLARSLRSNPVRAAASATRVAGTAARVPAPNGRGFFAGSLGMTGGLLAGSSYASKKSREQINREKRAAIGKAFSEKEKDGILYGAIGGVAPPVGSAVSSAVVARKGQKSRQAVRGAVAGTLGGPAGGAYAGYRAARGEGLRGRKLRESRVYKASTPEVRRQRRRGAAEITGGGALVAGGLKASNRGGQQIGQGINLYRMSRRSGKHGLNLPGLAPMAVKHGAKGAALGGAGVLAAGAGGGLVGLGSTRLVAARRKHRLNNGKIRKNMSAWDINHGVEGVKR